MTFFFSPPIHCVGALWGGGIDPLWGERLTGAGPRSQRGLESPGAEVGRCSLKDEGDRQGDKHGPLSTWGSSGFVVFLLLLLSLFFCSGSVVLPSFFGLSSSAFLPVWGRPCRRGENDALRRDAIFCVLLCFFVFFLAFSCVCRDLDSLDSHLRVSGMAAGGVLQPRDRGGRCGPVTRVFQLFRQAHTFKRAAAVEPGCA